MEPTLTSPSTSSTVVNGLSSPVKRKSEAQEKPKKKAKTTHSQDEGGTTTAESDAEQQSPPKTLASKAPKTPGKTPKGQKPLPMAESDVEEQSPPKTPAPKAPKTPGKTSKGQKPLPEGFSVIEKQRSGAKVEGIWKEYFGPDGKKYRSVAEIYKKLNIDPESGPGETSSSQEKMSTQEMKEQVEEVATNWNRGEEGDMAKNKNKFYNSVGLKKLPKTERHFTDVKSKKKGKASQEPVEDKDVAEEASSSTPLDVRSENQASVTISDTGDIKKKKKKKKNKENDKTV